MNGGWFLEDVYLIILKVVKFEEFSLLSQIFILSECCGIESLVNPCL